MIHRRVLACLLVVMIVALFLISGCGQSASATKAATLRLEVSLTPQEMVTFQPAIAALGRAHPERNIVLENTPQSGLIEKLNTQLAANTLPDVVRAQGQSVQTWIRRNAFLDLTGRIKSAPLDLTDFYAGPLEQFRWQGKLWGIPDTAAPDVVYYNKKMFDAAGLAYPTDNWTYEDMRRAAIKLTLDADSRTPADPGFDPSSIRQWGWNGALTMYWQRHLIRAFGADWCLNEDCTAMTFTAPDVLRAVEWWASLANKDHAGLYDPYGGSQTGVPGDPFVAGKAAMGYNGFFAVGQLNAASNIEYDVVQPWLGEDGKRHTPLSTNGYVISARSAHPDAAWALVQALLEPQFLSETWGKPGHSMPARRSAATSAINLSHPPAHQQAILAAMEYGEVFKPYTASSFEVYSKTGGLFQKAMKGEMPVPEAMRQIDVIANDILARDRKP